MAYRRRRTTYRRRYRRKALSKRQATAVKSIALGTVETKHRTGTYDWGQVLGFTGYVAPENSHAYVINLFGDVDRGQDPSVSPSNHNVEGNEFWARGFALELHLQQAASTATTPVYASAFRITVFRSNDYIPGDYNNILPNLATYVNTEYPGFTEPTQFKWDPKRNEILKQWVFKVNPGGAPSYLLDRKFWYRMNRRCIMESEEQLNTVGELAGWNYYCMIEVRQPGTTDLGISIQGNVITTVYWKDP